MSRLRARPGCSHEGCTRPATYRRAGVCARHYQQLVEAGALTPVGPRGEDHNAWKALDAIGFEGTHSRLRRKLGPASDYQCPACLGRALDWAMQPYAPNVRPCPKTGRRFSPPGDLTGYRPMCRACHNAMDHDWDTARSLNAVGIPRPHPLGFTGPLVRWDTLDHPEPPHLFDAADGVTR